MWKKQWGIMIALFVFCFFLPAIHASAAPELKVKVTAGFDGKAKYGKGAPITVVIENNGTSAFNGDMVIDTQQSYESGVGEVFPLDIGAGETKTVTFINQKMFDFNMYGINAKSIFFYEGGWKKGKEIEHKGNQQFTVAMYHDDTKMITAFTDNIDRLSALKGMRLTNFPSTQMIDASKIATIPEEAAGWGPADMIIVDEFPIADMQAAEQQALLNWVRSGGIIIFGGSDHLKAESGIFADHLPLTLNGKKTISPEVFNEWTSREDFDQEITIAASTLNPDSKVIFSKDKDILAATKPLGKGLVLQSTFSLGDEPFSKMHGAGAVWKNLLDTANQSVMSGGMFPYYNDPMESLRWTIGNSNELFPSFKVSAPLLFGVIIIYIIIIIPVLYIILKRKDKREHAWWIIPAISVVVSVFIFAYGARDRITQAQLQQTSIFEVEQDGRLNGYFVESILTNKAGDFVFSAPKETTMSTYTPYSMGIFGPSSMGMGSNSHKRAVLERSATDSNLHLRNIGYWDVATVYGQTTVDSIGNFDIALTVKDKQLTGEITNNFPFPVKEIAIWSGTTRIKVGDLGPGETINVNETLKTSTLIRKRSSNSMYMGQMPNTTDDLLKMRKDSLITFSGDFMSNESKPALIGYTDTKIVPIELEKTKATIDSLTMLSQSFTPKVEYSKSFTVDPEMMTMNLISEGNSIQAYPIGYAANMYYFEEDTYIQTWQIPEDLLQKVAVWKSMDISKIQKQLYTLQIWNEKTKSFEQLESERKVTLDSIDDYIAADGKVRFKLEFTNKQRGNEGQAPEMKIHGEVKK